MLVNLFLRMMEFYFIWIDFMQKPPPQKPYLGFGLGLRTVHYETILNERIMQWLCTVFRCPLAVATPSIGII